jgi:tetratricopeptide (TPR) repeat protein
MSVKRTLPVSLCLLIALSASANETLFDQAAVAARQGDLILMQQTYEKILVADVGNVRALNGKATAQAWRGNYFAAIETYRKSLVIEPENLEALLGIGYAFAWSGDYPYSEAYFDRALALHPEHYEALKGGAYVALWSGDAEAARSRFMELSANSDTDPEIPVAIGQANLQLGDTRAANKAFDRALLLDPGNTDAVAGRKAARNAKARLEAGAWYGSTSNADSGLRLVELGWWAGSDTRLSARYDDSLSLDNPAIVRRGESARTYLAGVQHGINDTLTVLLEAGVRQLPDGDQNLYRSEVVLNNLPGRVSLGVQFGDHELGYDDRLFHLGIGIPFAERWQIESNNYFSTVGVNKDDEWRSVLNLLYSADSGWNAMVGAGFGEVDREGLQNPENVRVAHAMVSLPVFDYHRLHLVLRNEDLPGATVNVAMLGFTLRLPR